MVTLATAAPGDLGSALLTRGCVLWLGRRERVVLASKLPASTTMPIGLRVYDWQGETPLAYMRKWLSRSKLQRELTEAACTRSPPLERLLGTFGSRTPWNHSAYYVPSGLLSWVGETSAGFKDPLGKVVPKMHARWDKEVIEPLTEALSEWLRRQHALQDTLALTDRDAWVREILGVLVPWLPKSADFPAEAPVGILTCAAMGLAPTVPGLLPLASPEAMDAWALKALPTGRQALRKRLTTVKNKLAADRWFGQAVLLLDKYVPRALKAHEAWDFTQDADGSVAAVRRLLDYRNGFLPHNPFTGPGAQTARRAAAALTQEALKAIHSPDPLTRNAEALLNLG